MLLQNFIFLLAGTIYFFADRLAHRKRFVRWRTTADHPHSYKSSHPVGVSSKDAL
jgi:hypothetical protein